MTAFLAPAISAIVWITVKASVLMGVAAILQAVSYRRASAALRHLVWTIAIVGVLLLPIMALVLPEWAVVTRTAATNVADAPPMVDGVEQPAALSHPSAPVAESVESTAVARGAVAVPPGGLSGAADTRSWSTVTAGMYAAGVLVMLIHLTRQRWSMRRLAREATDLREPEWTRLLRESAASMGVQRLVRLLRSRECSMPMAFGTWRPAILIPAVADTWPEDRRRAVILHELAHVARYDCLTQSLALAACTLYWFHPAAWWIARRLRIERELACDDRVITAGAQAREYAGHLLEIAFSLGRRRAPALAVTMARRGQLEGRMLAVLDAARNRSVPALRVRVATAAIAAVLLLPLASATSTVVALKSDADSGSATATPPPATEQNTVTERRLKAVEWPLIESGRRIVRAVAAAIGIPQNGLPGTWEIRPGSTEGTVHLRLVELNSSSGSDMPIQRLEGLTAAQLTGAGGPVQFRLRRDAGTFAFDGVVHSGIGAGTFSFTPDSNFPAELAKRGLGMPTALEQYQLARYDLGYAFVDELNKQGYGKPPISEIVRGGQHGVNITYLRDMGTLGYRLGAVEPLIELRDHGVTPTYIRELSEQGYKGLRADDLRQARDHGITSEYVRAMRAAGYGSLTMEQLINARDHGITAEYIRGLDEAGHRKLPLDQLIRARDHGVSQEYAREMRQLGYEVPIEELIRGRDHGVTPQYVQELKAVGYDRLSINDLVTLRDYGLTSDRIRAANTRAGTRLPVDLLKRLATGGMK
jgi:beta-lactamase regulating signal transducer with metallopeptidase domain